MGTMILYILFWTGDWEWHNPNLSKVGNALINILAVLGIILCLIVMAPLAIIENTFIIPAWLIYNLCHREDLKKSYVKFLGLDEL